MPAQQSPRDLPALVFCALQRGFFDRTSLPRRFALPAKKDTQADPLDQRIVRFLSTAMRRERAECIGSPGTLISPDLVVMRPSAVPVPPRNALRDPAALVGIEIKQLRRTAGGRISRSSDMDYNSTPPCGTIHVYNAGGRAIDVRGFYLFACVEPVPGSAQVRLTTLVLADGDFLNSDHKLYERITGLRSKETGQGSYGDGANRVRPMMLFANPLGCDELDRQATLIHSRADLEKECKELRHVGTLLRESWDGTRVREFHCYRARRDTAGATSLIMTRNPFARVKRSERTKERGRFVIWR